MTTRTIIKAGLALWGERWQAPMAAALGINRDTVQDWRQGRSRARTGALADLLAVARARQAELAQAIVALEATVAARAPAGPGTLITAVSPATDDDDIDVALEAALGGDMLLTAEARAAAAETTVEIHRIDDCHVVWIPDWGRAGVGIATSGTGDPIWTDASSPADAVRRVIEDDILN